LPAQYCDACKAQYDKKQQAKRECEKQERLKKNERQRKRYKSRREYFSRVIRPLVCTCGKEFKPKRSNQQYCSAACRQRAYVKRDGKASNAKPLSQEDVKRVIIDAFLSDPDGAFTAEDLCDRVYPGLKKVERKHRVAVVVAAKRVTEQLGEHRSWYRSETRGRRFVFWNRLSLQSYAMARLKSDFLNGYRCKSRGYWGQSITTTEDELRAEIAPGGRHHEHVVEGGAWWKHWQADVAEMKRQMTDKQNDASDDLTNRQQRAQFIEAAE
jgi:hypothetical protein